MSVVVTFRRDLRLHDNPALWHAASTREAIVPVFVWNPGESGHWAPGAASRWWIELSVRALAQSLEAHGLRLRYVRNDDELLALARENAAHEIFFNERFEPAERAADERTLNFLRAEGVEPHVFNGTLLWHPREHLNLQGKPYQVFTPFYKAARKREEPREPHPLPRLTASPASTKATSKKRAELSLEDLQISAPAPWQKSLAKHWTPGEESARTTLQSFVRGGLNEYIRGRDEPSIGGTSRLSAHLHHGELSPHSLWAAIKTLPAGGPREKFEAELCWREFSHALLFHFPFTADAPLREKYAKFPWRNDATELRKWQRGQTGFPIVDAGMRELWETGWMHNRVRMIASSFLVKDLLIPWQEGARWFWDTLVDADLANNTLGWQWAAGCGADAAPFFRIFNPTLQGQKFDPQQKYIQRWLGAAGGKSTKPMLDHSFARDRALAALRKFNGAAAAEKAAEKGNDAPAKTTTKKKAKPKAG